MKVVPALLIAIAALAGPAPAGAQDAPSPAGFYAAEMFETASAIELTEDGHFGWYFSTGALDLVGEGRWQLAGDGVVILDSDPPYEPPRFELVGTTRDERPGVLVKLDQESRGHSAYLDVEAEYAGGERMRVPFRPNGVRLADGQGRGPVAVRLGSMAFDFQSEPVAVSSDAGNVMTFRFHPNQIGRADFSGRRVILEPGGLSFEWRGTTLRYARAERLAETLATMEGSDPAGLDAAEADAAESGAAITEAWEEAAAAYAEAGGQISDAPLRSGPVLPWDVPEGAPSVGLYDIALGETFEATMARSTFPFRPEAGLGNEFADGVAEVRIRFGDSTYDAGRVTNLSWYVNERDDGPYVKAVGFSHQDRMLELGEALARARAVQAWLVQAGFTPGGPEEADPKPPFSLIDPYRYNEQVAGWDEAEALLADEETAIQGLDLFQMRARGWYATVTLISYSRGPDGPPVTVPGREWDLQIGFDSDLHLAPVSEGDVSEP